MVRTGKAPRVVLRFEFAHMASEIGTLKKAEDLAKKTGGGIHVDLRWISLVSLAWLYSLKTEILSPFFKNLIWT